ncbi:MAG: DUF6788 family protein [bacterium]
MRKTASRLRQKLLELGQDYQRHLEQLIGERGPLVRGSFGTRARRCGKPGCRCTQGELHESKYLTGSDDGRIRQIHVPAADEVEVQVGVDRYRRFRQTQARLIDLARSHQALADQLGRALLKPYPPNDPLPPPKRRGRRPRGGPNEPR